MHVKQKSLLNFGHIKFWLEDTKGEVFPDGISKKSTQEHALIVIFFRQILSGSSQYGVRGLLTALVGDICVLATLESLQTS